MTRRSLTEHRGFSVLIIAVLISLLGYSFSIGQVADLKPQALQRIDVEEHLGGFISLYAAFTDDAGDSVVLARYFNRNHPVILVLAYYTCPMLCNLVMNGLADALKPLDLTAGKDYSIVTVSIDTTETAELAAAKKANYRKYLADDTIADNWHFLVGRGADIEILAKSVGFRYFYDEKQKQYAHAAVLTILSPQGEISRYLYGIEYKTQDLKFALLEAADGKVGSATDRLLLYCYHYDPQAGGYVLFAAKLMRLGGIVTVGALALTLGFFWFKEFRKKRIGSAKIVC